MARPLRWDDAGAVHHVMARGRERSSIFRDDEDRQEFLLLPGSISRARVGSPRLSPDE
jgi:hypothetical protein